MPDATGGHPNRLQVEAYVMAVQETPQRRQEAQGMDGHPSGR